VNVVGVNLRGLNVRECKLGIREALKKRKGWKYGSD
jgi:hypothetical protein